jgi:hypothetical protein
MIDCASTKLQEQHAPAQYVDARKLLEILFAPECRPSVRWLRTQQAARKIPFVKISRLVFFDPVVCKAALDAKAVKRGAA